MSSTTDVETSYKQVMEATGFYRNGVPTSGVSETLSLRKDVRQLEKRIKYNAVINQLNATAIYELSGSPCIYFTQLSEADPEPKKLADLHKLAWNHGLAPMLWVITPTKVLLYNCYSQPTQEDENNPDKHLVDLFKTTEAGLRELKDKASRQEFESGEFWKWEKAKDINRKQRVDSVLVKDLTDTEVQTGIYAAFSSQDIVYTESYSGISVSEGRIANYTNGIINSSIASYFLFFTASTWGIERNKIGRQDLSRLPIPQPTEDNQNFVSRIIEIEGQLRRCRDESIEIKLKQQLDEAVFDLYGLDEMERILVEDMVNMTINLYMVREKSAAIKRPKYNELVQYAQSLISVIKPFLQTLNQRTIVADVLDVGNAPLQVVKFSLVSTPGREETVRTLPVQELETVLKNIAEQLSQEIADRIYTRRNLRIYVGEDIYLVKPAKRICWTRSAGLNDADIILSEQLKVNRDSIR